MPKHYKIAAVVMVIILIAVIIFACEILAGNVFAQDKNIVPEEVIRSHIIYPVETPAEVTSTPAPEPISDDAIWLARAMDAEDGINWNDEDIKKIGEVVLNRVASSAYPDDIESVLFQPGQYSPFFNYVEWMPAAHYIQLAEELLDGDLVFNDSSVVYQALFPQGYEVVDSVYDSALGSTTYFCR